MGILEIDYLRYVGVVLELMETPFHHVLRIHLLHPGDIIYKANSQEDYLSRFKTML